MAHWNTTAIACIVLLTIQAASLAAIGVAVRPAGANGRPTVFGRAEWIVEVDKQSANPFDPQEMAIDATFTGPDGRSMRIPAFWMQEHRREMQGNRERLLAVGKPHWRIRFCPPAAGQWQVTVAARSPTDSGTSPAVGFVAEPSKHPGFVRRVPDNPRYFQFDDGKPYFIVGMNVCWAGQRGLPAYESWLGKLGAAGGNFARLWMSYPSRPTENKQLGPGRYDLEACAFYDQVLEIADRNGIRCMMALGTYGDMASGGYFGEGKWPISPYNAANGGPATQPANLFTQADGRELYKRRLRYLIGRYSAYTSLGFWEFWNEQDNAPKLSIPPQWTAEMAAYLKANDPYKRLVTTSYAAVGQSEVWKMADIDLTQRHIYGDHESADAMYDRGPAITSAIRSADGFAKPHLIGELGICWRDQDTKHDPANTGANLHNGLWAAALSGAAGGAAHWWWDGYVDPKGHWDKFTGLAKFASAIDWPRCRFDPITVRNPVLANVKEEKLVDVVLRASATWGKHANGPIIIEQDGSASQVVPGFVYGPTKKDLRQPVVFKINTAVPSRMVLRIAKVSASATARVDVDGKEAALWAFSAKPGSPDIESTKPMPDHDNLYQAVINKDRAVDLAPGQHTITLDATEGDWLSIASVTFTNARSSKYTDLRVLALAETAGGQIIAWIADPASHCGSDAAGIPPTRYEGAVVSLPTSATTACGVEWWDTRLGRVIGKDQATPKDGTLLLTIPAFARDIALRVLPTLRSAAANP